MFIYQVEPEEVSKSVKLGPPDQKAENTLRHIAKGWLPVNPHLFKRVRDALKLGSALKRDQLVKPIKQDPGLYLYLARSLKQLAPEAERHFDPIEELHKLEHEKLATLFDVSESQISTHRLKETSKLQALRLQHSLVSAAAAEVLAPHAQLTPARAFTAASFHQLGLNLIAWNYPHIYSRYMTRVRAGSPEATAELRAILGLSPLEIGIRFAGTWQIYPEVRSTLALLPNGQPRKFEQQPRGTDTTAPLTDVIAVAELYADLKDPVFYPNTKGIWSDLQPQLGTIFPLPVLAQADAQVTAALKLYVDLSDVIASVPLAPKAEASHKGDERARQAQDVFDRNPYLRRCPEQVCTLFARVYAQIEPGTFSLNALRTLSNATIPVLGFDHGCLFFLDADNRTLSPALRVGGRSLTDYQDFFRQPDRGIQASPYNSAPFMTQGIGIMGKPVTHVAGSLDNDRYFGVLYLEIAEAVTEDAQRDPLLLFKAVRKALNDAMGVTSIPY